MGILEMLESLAKVPGRATRNTGYAVRNVLEDALQPLAYKPKSPGVVLNPYVLEQDRTKYPFAERSYYGSPRQPITRPIAARPFEQGAPFKGGIIDYLGRQELSRRTRIQQPQLRVSTSNSLQPFGKSYEDEYTAGQYLQQGRF